MAKRVFLVLIFLLFSVLAIVDLASANMAVLEREVAEQILAETPWNEADVEVDSINLRAYSSATDGFDSVRVTLPRPILRGGKVTVSVSLYRGGVEFKKFWASARVRLFKDVVVAINPLRKGNEIMEDDVELIRAEQRGTQSIASSLEEVLGMTAKRPINPGDIIKRSYIVPMKLIKRGEVVTLKIETDKLKVSSQGKAMQNGARGDVISVRTLSGKEIYGTVIGPGELRVAF
jgi:flagella basal body P-ring formation protein FlgA